MLFLGTEPIRELDAVLDAMVQFTRDILDLALESLRMNKSPNAADYTQITKTISRVYSANTSINEE